MKKDSSKKKNPLLAPKSASAPPIKKKQEVTVVRHYKPTPGRKQYGNHFPEVNTQYVHEPNETTKYFQYNSVFKLVDNFLSSSLVHNTKGPSPRPTGVNIKRTMAKSVKCPPLESDNGFHNAKIVKFNTKRSSIMNQNNIVRGCTPNPNHAIKDDIIKTNLNNINSNSDLRLSLTDFHCKQCESVKKCEPTNPPNNYFYYRQQYCTAPGPYIQELKNEIKASQAQIDYSRVNDYANKLKNEIEVNRTRCLDEARNIINDLKNEIINYRLRAKTKYSSSCSDISDKCVQSPPIEKNKEDCGCGERKGGFASGGDSPEKLCRPRPFETIWVSKRSLASNSDVEEPSKSRDYNFEEQLEEATTLIDKVKRALRDIKGGVQNKPIEEVKSPTKLNEPVQEKDENNAVNEIDATPQKKSSRVEEIEINDEDDHKSEHSTPKSKCQCAKKKSHHDEKVEDVVDEVIRADYEDKTASPVAESMETLHTRLNTISELSSESECSSESKKKNEVPSSLVAKVERATSPIIISHKSDDEIESGTQTPPNELRSVGTQKTDIKEEPSDEQSTSTENPVSVAETNLSNHSFTTQPQKASVQIVNSDDAKSDENENEANTNATQNIEMYKTQYQQSLTTEREVRRKKELVGDKLSKESSVGNRTAKLSKQVMPPISIRGSLVMQKTLNLSIKPTGSTIYEAADGSNIGYEEVVKKDSATILKEGDSRDGLQCPGECKSQEEKSSASSSESEEDIPVEKITFTKKMPRSVDYSDRKNLEKTLLMFKSFQILDEEHVGSHMSTTSLANRTHHMVRSAVKSEKKYGSSSDKFDAPGRTRRVSLTSSASPKSKRKSTETEVSFSLPSAVKVNSKSKQKPEGKFVGIEPLKDVVVDIYKNKNIVDNFAAPSEDCSEHKDDLEEKSKKEDLGPKQKFAKQKKFRNARAFGYKGNQGRQGSTSSSETHVLTVDTTPWDIGFYKTTATQCNESSFRLEGIDENTKDTKPSITAKHESSSGAETDHTEEQTGTVSNVQENYAASTVPSVSSESDDNDARSVPIPVHDEVPVKDTSQQSVHSEASKISDVHRSEEIQKTVDGVSEASSEPPSQADKKAPTDKVPSVLAPNLKKKNSVPMKSESLGTKSLEETVSPSSNPDKVDDNSDKKSVDSKISKTSAIVIGSSSSSSTYNIHGSSKNSLSQLYPKVRTKKSSKLSQSDKSGKSEVSEEKNKTAVSPTKIDKNLQISLSSTSESIDSQASSENNDDKVSPNTSVANFIRSLTGVTKEKMDQLSRDKMDQLSSQTNFPDETKDPKPDDEESREQIVGEHDLEKGFPQQDSTEDTLEQENSEDLKKKRFKEFQKNTLNVDSSGGDTKGPNRTHVLRVTQEGIHEPLTDFYKKRNTPFYRRMLGGILDPNRKYVNITASDPVPVEESFSEGEINCKCSISIGELHQCKYPNDVRKNTRFARRQHEQIIKKEFGDKGLRIARQRTQYNNWVTYYLQKNRGLLYNDSSSSDNSKK